MKNNKRSAFTIVELVIVIAVIAILSAVLIPTFGAIIRDANVAADETAAKTLTSELHVYLKGKQIKNEADLVDALNKSGIGAKLTPSVEGIHFWYDMEAQMFVVKELKEVNPASRAVAPANTSFRDLYNKNLYLVDYYVLGELFSTADVAYDVFSYIDDLATAEQYANLITILSGVADNHAYKTIANDILAKVHNTTIRTEAGAFFSVEGNAAKNEYFSAGATFVGNGYFKYDGTNATTTTAAPLPAGVVNIPAYIDHIVEDGLNYAETTATITISLNRVGILAPGFTNANVLIGDNTYRIYPETNEKEDELVNVDDATDIIPLTIKVPFDEFVISYDKKGAVNNVSDRIYVAFRNETLKLNVANKNDISQTSNMVDKWELVGIENNDIINESTGIINLENVPFAEGSNVAEFKVKATAHDISGKVEYVEATIIVAKPAPASITIETNSGSKTFGSNDSAIADENAPQLLYNGDITSYVITTSGNYGADSEGNSIDAILGIAPVVSTNSTTFAFEEGGAKLVFNDGDSITSGAILTFTVTADGCIDITVKVKMMDADQALFNANFHHNRTNDRKYYIGSANAIKLSDLYSASELFGSSDRATEATVTIYDKGSATGNLFKINTANNDLDPFDITTSVLVDADGNFTTDEENGTFKDMDTITITPDNMDEVVIKFTIEEDNRVVNGILDYVYIEIMPNDNSVTTVTLFEIVQDGKNVTSASGLVAKDQSGNITTHTSNLVLQGDITDVANTDKVNLGDKTLYGNGYKIVAKQYKPADKTLNDYFISVNGGVIDNIYLDGPVYPDFDYDAATNGTHISGIIATGTSTIQNSYVSHFRQPVSAQGDVLNVLNTTLEGGNYANLQLVYGHLNLTNVTTVQNSAGYLDTIDGDTKIIGFGIFIESSALPTDGTSANKKTPITITGYLDQFNWIAKSAPTNGIYMPTVMDIDLNNVFPQLYNTDMFNSMKNYVHTIGEEQYVNGGILCMILNPTSFDDTLPGSYKNVYTFPTDSSTGCIQSGYKYDAYIKENLIVDNKSGKENESDIASYKTLYSLYMPTFSYKVQSLSDSAYWVARNASSWMGATAAHYAGAAARAGGTVAIKTLLSSMGIDLNKIDAQINIFTYSNQNFVLGSEGFEINYTDTNGYYVNYGN